MEELFRKYIDLKIAVVGDYCLDEYLRIDASLNEPSLETGLVAYQCVKRETFPGAAGTIAKNLAVLGVGTVYAVGYVGNDGRGLEMRRDLEKLGILCDCLVSATDRVTPAYVKPWISENGVDRELSRIDIKNWTPTPKELEDAVMAKLEGLLGGLDALIILDQMTEENCGIITDTVRERLAAYARRNPNLIFYADSRSRISKFRDMMIKGNQFEIVGAAFGAEADATEAEIIESACKILRQKTGKPVIVTLGAQGVRGFGSESEFKIPGVALTCQLDVCGAGDAFSAAFVSACAAGAGMELAAKIGNTAAAICCTQLGTSGYITAQQIMVEYGYQISATQC